MGSTPSSDLQCNQVSCIGGATGLSQSTLSSIHNKGESCNNGDTNALLVMSSTGGNSATVRGKWSTTEFHSIPNVFLYTGLGQEVDKMTM